MYTYILVLISYITNLRITEFSDILLKTIMRTMTNEDCIEKAPEILKDVVHPSDMCASGEEVDPSTNLESDGLKIQVRYAMYYGKILRYPTQRILRILVMSILDARAWQVS